MEKILIIGASGHAKVIIEAIELNQEYEIYGLIDSYKPKGQRILGYEVIGTEEILPDIVVSQNIKKGVIAIGDNWVRSKMSRSVLKMIPDFQFISVIHPSAVISKYATIGEGTVALASVNVNAEAKIGKFCILNTDSNFGHDCYMGDFSSLAPNVSIGGNVSIGEYTSVSIGASVIHNVTIGKYALIGAGAVVVKDIDDFTVAYGVPAKKIRCRKKDEEYLTHPSLDNSYSFEVKSLNSEKDENDYRHLLTKDFGINVYYTVEYMKYFTKESDQLFYFLLTKENTPITLMPFILRKITISTKSVDTSLLFDVITPYGYNGPFYTNNTSDKDSTKFWELADQWYHENGVVSEFIRFTLNNNFKNYSGKLIESLSNVKGKLLDNFDDQWTAFASKVRNNFRKAVNYDLRFKMFHKADITKEIISVFNDIYVATMHRNNADSIYFFSEEYFENLILNNSDNFSIAVAFYDEIPISVELIINYEGTLFAFLGGTNSDYFSYRPNDFLRVKIIEWAIQNNFKYYVLGGGLKNGDGLYKSKKALFPKDEDVIFYTGRKIVNQKVYDQLSILVNSDYKSFEDQELDSSFFPFYRSV